MKGIKKFLFNVLLVTISSLIIRTIGMAFQVWLSNTIGAEGIGLFQLILSVYSLGITFAISGSRLAVTRLVAEELGVRRERGARAALRLCLIYGLTFGMLSGGVLFWGAGFIGETWLGDARTIPSLKILALGLPLLSLSSVFSGYFTAVRRVMKSAVAQLSEQLTSVLLTVMLFTRFFAGDFEQACVMIVVGILIGDIVCLILQWVFYLQDIRKYSRSGNPPPKLFPRMIRIAVPVALGAYISSAMRTLQHLLVPAGLKKSGLSGESALASYGTIHGMVLPIMMYPSVLFFTLSDLLVPYLAQYKARGDHRALEDIISKVLRAGLNSALWIMGFFLFYAEDMSALVYKTLEPASYMRVLAPLIPLMYLDTLVDGILKGIGEQVHTMLFNSAESFLSVIAIYFLLPLYAIDAYIGILLVARTFNFSLSLCRLVAVTSYRISVSAILKAGLCLVGAFSFSGLLDNAFALPAFTRIISYTALDLALLFLLFPDLPHSLSTLFRQKSVS